MPRKLNNWLESYLDYTEDTESATVFHKWVGLSMLASVLRKKTWFNFGRIRIYPNMYVVLVADPGVARKTQAISYGLRFIAEMPGIHTSADSTTREAFIQDIETASEDEAMEDGTTFKHASLTVISREFESFLGQKKENTKMLVFLTDIFDCEELPWKYRTKASGSNIAPAVFVNLIGATTPESLASSLPPTAIGGGLTSRIMFVWAGGKAKKIPVPFLSEKALALREPLSHDLSVISRISGEYNFSTHARYEWDNWYNAFEETSTKRICKDPAFSGWYSRKPMYTIKIATILTAARTDERVIQWEQFLEAMDIIEDIEKTMGKAFTAVGRSIITSDVDLVMSIIKRNKVISEPALLQQVWRDVDSRKFDNVISTAIRGGNVKRVFQSPTGEKGQIWYAWIGDN